MRVVHPICLLMILHLHKSKLFALLSHRRAPSHAIIFQTIKHLGTAPSLIPSHSSESGAARHVNLHVMIVVSDISLVKPCEPPRICFLGLPSQS